MRLILPQCIMKSREDGCYSINGQVGGQFVFKYDEGIIKPPIDPSCNLPMVTMFHDATKASENIELCLYSYVTKESNQQLLPTQKEMLHWYARLGHPSMAIVREIGKRGLLMKWGTKVAFSQAGDPKCATCQYGKRVWRSIGSTHTQL